MIKLRVKLVKEGYQKKLQIIMDDCIIQNEMDGEEITVSKDGLTIELWNRSIEDNDEEYLIELYYDKKENVPVMILKEKQSDGNYRYYKVPMWRTLYIGDLRCGAYYNKS
jgi:hypothetical protein